MSHLPSCKFFYGLVYFWDMYVHLYTHYGRKGHLAKFCYDRLNDSNFINRYVWVRKGANPYGSNRVWVPKVTPTLIDVGVGSRLT